MVVKRLFVGNLPEAISNTDVASKFSHFGHIEGVEVKSKNGGTFAFVNLDFEEERSIVECIDTLNHTKWRGNQITVQPAKENFLDKLKREQEQNNSRNKPSNNRAPAAPPPPPQIQNGSSERRLLPPLSPAAPIIRNIIESMKAPVVKSPVKPAPKKVTKKQESEEDSDSDADEIHPFPPFRGLNAYPELQPTKAAEETEAESGRNNNSISNRFLAIAGAAPPKAEAPPKVDLSTCNTLQSKLLAIAGQKQLHANKTQSPRGNNNNNNQFQEQQPQQQQQQPPPQKWTQPPPLPRPEPKPEANLIARATSQKWTQPPPPPRPEPKPEANLIARATPLNFKKKNSDEVRQKSFEARLNLNKNRSDIIKHSLANVLPPVNEPKTVVTDGKETTKNNGLSLFEDESDEDVESSFKIRPQFEGTSGEKNLELSSKFANYDSRFALDQRFTEPGEDEEAGDGKSKDEENLEQEKEANFAILSDILGTTVAPKSKPKAAPDFKSVIIPRYDPDNDTLPEPSTTTKQGKKSKQTEAEPVKEEEQPKILSSEKATYTVASNLKELFSDAQPTFSFFNASSSGQQEVDQNDPNQDEEPLEKRSKTESSFWQAKNPFKYDSSDSEDEEDDPSKQEVSIKIHGKEGFFFKRKDRRFKGLDNYFLRNEENLDDVLYRFNNGERSELKLICKGKIKNTKRKSDRRIETLRRLKRKATEKRKLTHGPRGSNAVPVGPKTPFQPPKAHQGPPSSRGFRTQEGPSPRVFKGRRGPYSTGFKRNT